MIQSTITFSKNSFHSLLSDIDINSFFIKPVDKKKKKIQNIILSLNPLKAFGSIGIQTEILKLLSIDISNLLCELFNHSISLGVFP